MKRLGARSIASVGMAQLGTATTARSKSACRMWSQATAAFAIRTRVTMVHNSRNENILVTATTDGRSRESKQK